MYPANFFESRARFRQAATALSAKLLCFPIPTDECPDLSIDIALIGSQELPAIVVSSGLHGVEASVGAAIQLAWMEAQQRQPLHGRFILIHAINPYGFAMGRRVDENNVDLNRNFLIHSKGASAEFNLPDAESSISDYARFNTLLNPACAPKLIDSFLLQALGYLACEGKQKLQAAIVTGQYEFENGLFYGGNRVSPSVKIIQEQVKHWIGDAPEVCHIDVHTGLGRFAECQLLVQTKPDSAEFRWLEKAFGMRELVSTDTSDSDAYQPLGAMGHWLTAHISDRPYRFVTAEFGTYSALSVLSALRRENQAFHFTQHLSGPRIRARRRLEKCFCPSSSRWQYLVLERGLKLLRQDNRELM